MIAVYSENHAEHINTLRGHNAVIVTAAPEMVEH
jgi:hypothetical protein